MSAPQFSLLCSVAMLGASSVIMARLILKAIWYKRTRKELDRYMAHLRQAVEDNDEVSFRRWEARLTDVLEYAKEKMDRM